MSAVGVVSGLVSLALAPWLLTSAQQLLELWALQSSAPASLFRRGVVGIRAGLLAHQGEGRIRFPCLRGSLPLVPCWTVHSALAPVPEPNLLLQFFSERPKQTGSVGKRPVFYAPISLWNTPSKGQQSIHLSTTLLTWLPFMPPLPTVPQDKKRQ